MVRTTARPGLVSYLVAGPLGWGALCAGVALLCLLAVPARASADTAPVPISADASWADPAHRSQLELLAGQIASGIAGRSVTVRCEGAADWSALVRGRGGDPSAESGHVVATWNDATGRLVSSGTAELAGREICSRLNSFATAATKPTKCVVPAERARATQGAGRTATRKSRRVVPRFGPCYLGNGKTVRPMTAAYWSDYESYAIAILTLAHEAIHLGGVVGGQLANGEPVGDRQAEAKAECYGMQSMAYVAERLGDTPDDAHAIAAYFWDRIYARAKTASYSQYWSPDCRPGGALDIRPAGAVAWP